ncbi:hypothetical protein BDZ45DRAFT_742182 [Acephala macrosclerotiorum]|nr:hypothetical protein BDZ45DRAFT_742182 [Acephala macrosclerotiorum]
MKTSGFFSGVVGVALSLFHAIDAQDFAIHGTYTHPDTNITFYTSSAANGTSTGDGELSTVSWGGFTFTMAVSELPYGDPNDLATVATAIDNMVNNLKSIPNITWSLPPPGVSGADYLKTIDLTCANIGTRRANHWWGLRRWGPIRDSLVMELQLLILIAKFMGWIISFALIVTASEHASNLILALPYSQARRGGHHRESD